MNLGEKTKKNLEEAFAGESKARNKYDYFASAFRKAGYVQIANIFEETAKNEKEHAKVWAKQLGIINDDLKDNLRAAIEGENYENSQMYPRMEKEALEEGHEEIAKLFHEVAEVEEKHEARYQKLLENIENGEVFKKKEVKRWKCNNCGYIHEGEEAPITCPACSHPQGHFEVFVETY
ncbi:MAG: rubrerythrin family protein [Patescibacteria group bacterium]|jgi:rubrerythrin|nr:rubrerythrin family protein [Patescibacteria group bacterium]